MSIITISKGSYSYGKEIAEKLAEKLGYECVSREILLDASEEFCVPEIKLINAIHDSFGILDRFTHGKEKYIAYIRAALLKRLRKNNTIYHGLAGHFFLQNVTHVLKVRIIADLDSRVEIVMKRDKVNAEKALHILEKDDDERRKWSQTLHGIDTQNPKLYDMVLHIGGLTVDDAVNIIAHAAGQASFNTTPESQQMLNDLALEAKIVATLVVDFPTIHASVTNGNVLIHVKGPIDESKIISDQIEATVRTMAGVETVNIDLSAFTLDVKL